MTTANCTLIARVRCRWSLLLLSAQPRSSAGKPTPVSGSPPALLYRLAGNAETCGDVGPGVTGRPEPGHDFSDGVVHWVAILVISVMASMSPAATRRL
jgi:hypothetical protein